MSHARLSPSSAHRWVPCPGSVREEAKYPEEPGGPAAIDGTHSHTLLEDCLKSGTPAADFIGRELSDHEGSFTVDEERAERVQVALDYVAARMAELPQPVKLTAEERVNPGGWFDRPDLNGTADIQLEAPRFLEMIDYKDGMAPVSALNNEQLELYLMGALFEHRGGDGSVPFDEFRITIIQPKLRIHGQDPISYHNIRGDQFVAIVNKFSAAAAATDAPDAPLVPGPRQCKWCRAKSNCSSLAGKALEEAQILFAPAGGQDLATQSSQVQVADLTLERKVEILEATPLINAFLASVKEDLEKRALAGELIPGCKVVLGRGSSTWTEDEDETAKKLRNMGVPKSAIYPEKLVSPAAAKKMRWVVTSGKMKGETKALSKKQLENLDKELITKSKGAKTLVLESDSREAVLLNAEEIFKEVQPDGAVTDVEPEVPALPSFLQTPDWLK